MLQILRNQIDLAHDLFSGLVLFDIVEENGKSFERLYELLPVLLSVCHIQEIASFEFKFIL